LIQKRGAEVIKARGASSAASAAHAVVTGVNQLVADTPAGDWFSVAKCSFGEYGVDEGLIFSYPMRCQDGKLSMVEGLSFNDFGKEKFQFTLNELRKEYEAVKALGLIKG
jgi:malate dehydrogenase